MKGVEMFPDYQTGFGNNSLYGRKDNFIFEGNRQFFKLLMKKGRRNHKNQIIGAGNGFVHIVAEFQLLQIKFNRTQVIWVVAVFFYKIYCLLASHIPANLIEVFAKHFYNGSCPTTASKDCKFWFFRHQVALYFSKVHNSHLLQIASVYESKVDIISFIEETHGFAVRNLKCYL